MRPTPKKNVLIDFSESRAMLQDALSGRMGVASSCPGKMKYPRETMMIVCRINVAKNTGFFDFIA